MKLSIIVPAHNEEKTIARVLGLIFRLDLGQWDREIIVVNDGSADSTTKILEAEKNIILVTHPKNLGKGSAIKSALEKVTGDYVIIQDADLEYFPEDIPKLLANLAPLYPRLLLSVSRSSLLEPGEGCGIVFGNRGIKRYPERGFHYVIGAKLLTWAINILYGAHLADLYTGYKLIPTALIRSLKLESAGFEFEAEVTCKILKAGYKIQEVPISYKPRSKEQGKHIGLKDAFLGLWTIVKFRVK